MEREAGGLSWAETVAMRNELRLAKEAAAAAEAETTRVKAALQQVTEQHGKLVEELATQYRDAERVGWLPPKEVKKLRKTLDAITKKYGPFIVDAEPEEGST
jgi:predicted DNA-binding protein (UPF0278 family)